MRIIVIALLLTVCLALLSGSLGWANARFARETDALVKTLFERVPSAAPRPVRAEELSALPEPVRRWLETAGVVGRPHTVSVRLEQRGGMRTAPDQTFSPVEAVQYFSVTEPGLVWSVKLAMFHVPIVGRDSYLDGAGRMLIKAGALLPLVDAIGGKIDQGTLLRFLGELVWFPSGALSPYVSWKPVDASTARATMSYRGVTAAADFSFDAQARVTGIGALRYLKNEPNSKLERWIVKTTHWRRFSDGVLVPDAGEVTWQLNTGAFTYYQWEITTLKYNPEPPYP